MRGPDCLDQRQGHLVISDVLKNEGCAPPRPAPEGLEGALGSVGMIFLLCTLICCPYLLPCNYSLVVALQGLISYTCR